MRKSIYVFLLLSVFSFVTVLSCNKTSKSTSAPIKSQQNESLKFVNGGGNDIVIVGWELRRKRGEKKKPPRKGEACNCVSCFGLCNGNKIIDDGDYSQGNVILEDLGSGVARAYLLEEPEEDADVDPTFYIDDDVVLNDGLGGPYFITVLAGEYPYSNTPGSIEFEGDMYSYYGTVDLNFTE